AETAGVEEIFEVVHGEQFLLIDGKGRIRGYYATEDGGVQILQRDIMNLIRRDE
ncbi:MAG TPA: SCO family protein, partial [Deltaproteobacteria bacterium]|nr:SCO family protein [Deltaproteobacteria bacterium]